MNKTTDNPNYLFTLRVPVFRGWITIHAFNSHNRIDVEVSLRERFNDDKGYGYNKPVIIFPHGDTYCQLPKQHKLDGIHAKELVLSLVAIKPGDTDNSYFEDYTLEQLAFARKYGEELDCVRQFRYCDANGNIRKGQ